MHLFFRSMTAAAALAASFAAAGAQAATLTVTGLGPVGPFGNYAYDFGAVALGTTQSVSFDVTFQGEGQEIFLGNGFQFYPLASNMTMSPGFGAGNPPDPNSFTCFAGGCSMTVEFTPTTLGEVISFMSIDYAAIIELDPNCGTGIYLENCQNEQVHFTSFAFFGGTGTDEGGPSAVPLPAALPLVASGIGALGLVGWRRKRKSK